MRRNRGRKEKGLSGIHGPTAAKPRQRGKEFNGRGRCGPGQEAWTNSSRAPEAGDSFPRRYTRADAEGEGRRKGREAQEGSGGANARRRNPAGSCKPLSVAGILGVCVGAGEAEGAPGTRGLRPSDAPCLRLIRHRVVPRTPHFHSQSTEGLGSLVVPLRSTEKKHGHRVGKRRAQSHTANPWHSRVTRIQTGPGPRCSFLDSSAS